MPIDHDAGFDALMHEAFDNPTPEMRKALDGAAAMAAAWDGVTPDHTLDALIGDEI